MAYWFLRVCFPVDALTLPPIPGVTASIAAIPKKRDKKKLPFVAVSQLLRLTAPFFTAAAIFADLM